MCSIFITGTDTAVGKTTVAIWIAMHMNLAYWKPIQSGIYDSDEIQIVSSLTAGKIYPTLYSFQQPLSPHLAAKINGVHIDINVILTMFNTEFKRGPMIIEGAGGVFVPLNERDFVIDLIAQLNIPTIVIARSTLGTINHTYLTVEALRMRNIQVLGVVMNGPINYDNNAAIEQYCKTKVLAVLPMINKLNSSSIRAIALSAKLQEVVELAMGVVYE